MMHLWRDAYTSAGNLLRSTSDFFNLAWVAIHSNLPHLEPGLRHPLDKSSTEETSTSSLGKKSFQPFLHDVLHRNLIDETVLEIGVVVCSHPPICLPKISFSPHFPLLTDSTLKNLHRCLSKSFYWIIISYGSLPFPSIILHTIFSFYNSKVRALPY